MTARGGLLLVMMGPPPPLDEEFNAWYDTEHVPSRLAVPGVETARRFVCVTGTPRYMALYDLQTLAVAESDAYRAIAGANSSPWTRRMLARLDAYTRIVAEQIEPGNAFINVPGKTAWLSFMRTTPLSEEHDAEAIAAFRDLGTGSSQLRVFREASAEGMRYLCTAEYPPSTEAPQIDVARAAAAGFPLDTANIYRPYHVTEGVMVKGTGV